MRHVRREGWLRSRKKRPPPKVYTASISPRCRGSPVPCSGVLYGSYCGVPSCSYRRWDSEDPRSLTENLGIFFFFFQLPCSSAHRVNDGCKYPTARVPGESYSIFLVSLLNASSPSITLALTKHASYVLRFNTVPKIPDCLRSNCHVWLNKASPAITCASPPAPMCPRPFRAVGWVTLIRQLFINCLGIMQLIHRSFRCFAVFCASLWCICGSKCV